MYVLFNWREKGIPSILLLSVSRNDNAFTVKYLHQEKNYISVIYNKPLKLVQLQLFFDLKYTLFFLDQTTT